MNCVILVQQDQAPVRITVPRTLVLIWHPVFLQHGSGMSNTRTISVNASKQCNVLIYSRQKSVCNGEETFQMLIKDCNVLLFSHLNVIAKKQEKAKDVKPYV